jgi:hypothetical protein
MKNFACDSDETFAVGSVVPYVVDMGARVAVD